MQVLEQTIRAIISLLLSRVSLDDNDLISLPTYRQNIKKFYVKYINSITCEI
jgi:hypothetical protein